MDGTRAAECFRFEPEQGGWYAFSMRSDEVDSYLTLYLSEDGGFRELASDDDSGGPRAFDAEISIELESEAEYVLEASTYSQDDRGSFEVAVRRLSEPPRPPRERLQSLIEAITLAQSDTLRALPSLPDPSELVLDEGQPAAPYGFCKQVNRAPLPDFQDPLHPNQFLRVTERTHDGRMVPVYRQSQAVSQPEGEQAASPDLVLRREVDERSTILVGFDRPELVKHSAVFDVALTVIASTTGENDPPVEVKGYRVIGQRATPASASVTGAQTVVARLCDVAGWQAPRELWFFETAAEVADSLQRDLIETTRGGAANLGEVQGAYWNWFVELARYGAGLRPLRRWGSALGRLGGMADRELEPLTDLLNTTPQQLRDLASEMEDAVDSLLVFSASGSQNNGADPDGVLAARAVRAVRGVDGAREAFEPVMAEVQNLLIEPRTRGRPLRRLSEALARRLIHRLRDGEIPLKSQGIERGETLLVEVANVVDGDTVPRAMVIVLEVVRFDVDPVPNINDAFLFLNRIGIRKHETRFAGIDPGSVPSAFLDEVTAPEPASALPTPGVSALWTYYPREGGWLGELARFARPGFGVNVAFARFGTKVTKFSPPADGTGSGTVVVEETTQDLGFAVGGLLALQEGLIQFTWGYNFGVEEKRWYWGLGLSFIELGQRAGVNQ